jgi:N-carbamoylputrescine amidase
MFFEWNTFSTPPNQDELRMPSPVDHSSHTVRVACAQIEPIVGETDANLAKTEQWIGRAAEQGVDIIVFPELSNSGYLFNSREEAYALSEEIPAGVTVKRWQVLADQWNMIIVGGINERSSGNLYNTAVLIEKDVPPRVYRKLHLWDQENKYFKPGNLGIPVFSTRIAKIAMLICYDCWFPEAIRSCALGGADLVCIPTNWVPIPGQAPDKQAMANILVQAAAHSNSIYVAAADRIGTERGQKFIGQSIIVSYTGWPAAGPAAETGEVLITADIPIERAKTSRAWNEFNNVLNDRRPETYGTVLTN